MFRNTADEDYIVSRWCAFAHKPYQFYWNGAQTLEKYLKCCLLLNGVKVIEFRHDVLELYDAVLPIAGDILPWLFVPPQGFSLERGSPYRAAEPYADVVKRFGSQGDPSNRYRTTSIVADMFDLLKFDELSFQLRRICFPLDMPYSGLEVTYREILKSDPSFQPHLPLHSIRSERTESDREALRIAMQMNFSYFPDEAYKNQKYLSSKSMENAELFLTTSYNNPESHLVITWLLEHCLFPKSIKTELFSWLETNKHR